VGTTRAPYSPHLSRRDAALIPYAVQPRDERMQEVLATYRCMTAPMIAASLQEPVQSVRNRLQRMFKHRFCRRYHVGIRHLVYTPHWVSRGQNPYLLHDLMASEFRLTLELAIRLCPDWGYAWKASWELRSEKGEVMPDAELVLFRRQGDKRAEVFVRCEFDRATESPSRVAGQCGRYLAWRREERKRDPQAPPFYVAWITTSARRVVTPRAAVERHVGTARMFLFTHEGRYTPADPATILGPIWQGLGEHQERPLLA
jgi:Replication-relaxation